MSFAMHIQFVQQQQIVSSNLFHYLTLNKLLYLIHKQQYVEFNRIKSLLETILLEFRKVNSRAIVIYSTHFCRSYYLCI